MAFNRIKERYFGVFVKKIVKSFNVDIKNTDFRAVSKHSVVSKRVIRKLKRKFTKNNQRLIQISKFDRKKLVKLRVEFRIRFENT